MSRWARLVFLENADAHLREVIVKAAAVMAVRAIGMATAFGFSIVLARLVGARGSGQYYLALTIALAGTTLASLGLHNASMRFIASYLETGDDGAARATQRSSLRVTLATSLAVAAIVVALAPWLAGHAFHDPALGPVIRIMGASIVPATLLNIAAFGLRAARRSAASALVQTTGASALSLALLVPLASRLGTAGVAVAYLTSQTVFLVIATRIWERTVPARGERTSLPVAPLLRVALPMLLVGSMNLLMRWTDTVMLGLWRPSSVVGVYGVVVRTAMLMVFVLEGFNSILAPKFAAMHAAGDREAMGRLAQRSTLAMTAASLPLLLAFTIVPTPILHVFGTDFAAGAAALTVLAVGQFVNVSTGAVGFLLLMTGNEVWMQGTIVVTAILNVTLNALLIPPYGMLGAAIATATCLAGMNLVLAYVVRRRLGISTFFALAAVRPRARRDAPRPDRGDPSERPGS